jgi:hypothetical protein
MAKILTLSDKPPTPRKKPNSKTLKEWARKNARFSRMPINRPVTKTDKWIPTKEDLLMDDVCTPQSKVQDNIISSVLLGMAAYKLFG